MRLATLSVRMGTILGLLIAFGQAQVVPPTAELKITISDESGALIPDCEVAFKGDFDVAAVHTGMDGAVTVKLPSGRYAVTISKAGFVKNTKRDVNIMPPTNTLRAVLEVDHTPIVDGLPGPTEVSTATSELPNVIAPETFIAPDSRPQTAKKVRVSDAATALKIAEPALIKTYGKRQIDSERPLTAKLDSGIWTVYGTLCCADRNGHHTSEEGKCLGGEAVLKLRQSDGKILPVIHYK